MAVTIKKDVPFGGGLGNKKVMIAELSGTYATGGFALFKEEPLFAITSTGYTVAVENEKVVLKDGGKEVTAATDVSGVKIFAIF